MLRARLRAAESRRQLPRHAASQRQQDGRSRGQSSLLGSCRDAFSYEGAGCNEPELTNDLVGHICHECTVYCNATPCRCYTAAGSVCMYSRGRGGAAAGAGKEQGSQASKADRSSMEGSRQGRQGMCACTAQQDWWSGKQCWLCRQGPIRARQRQRLVYYWVLHIGLERRHTAPAAHAGRPSRMGQHAPPLMRRCHPPSSAASTCAPSPAA